MSIGAGNKNKSQSIGIDIKGLNINRTVAKIKKVKEITVTSGLFLIVFFGYENRMTNKRKRTKGDHKNSRFK
jgi:hypothetical protein